MKELCHVHWRDSGGLARAEMSTWRHICLSHAKWFGVSESRWLLWRNWRPIRLALCGHQSRQRDSVAPVWLVRLRPNLTGAGFFLLSLSLSSLFLSSLPLRMRSLSRCLSPAPTTLVYPRSCRTSVLIVPQGSSPFLIEYIYILRIVWSRLGIQKFLKKSFD
jgi:hypothetical protein